MCSFPVKDMPLGDTAINTTSTFCFIINMDDLLTGLSQGIIPGLIVLAYLVIVKWLDSKKESRIETLAKSATTRVEELTNNISTIILAMKELSIELKNITNNIIERDKEKCKVNIELAFMNFTKELCDFGFLTIYNNHLDTNKDIVEQNTKTIVNSEFYKMYSSLSLYEVNGVRPNQFLKTEWKDEFEDALLKTIYKENITDLERVNILRTKLNLKAKDCSNYVYNNIFAD